MIGWFLLWVVCASFVAGKVTAFVETNGPAIAEWVENFVRSLRTTFL